MAAWMKLVDIQTLGNAGLAELVFDELLIDSDGNKRIVDSDSANEGSGDEVSLGTVEEEDEGREGE